MTAITQAITNPAVAENLRPCSRVCSSPAVFSSDAKRTPSGFFFLLMALTEFRLGSGDLSVSSRIDASRCLGGHARVACVAFRWVADIAAMATHELAAST
jgi:hypothetical protein